MCTCALVLQPLHKSLQAFPAHLWQAALSRAFLIDVGCHLKVLTLQFHITELSKVLQLQLRTCHRSLAMISLAASLEACTLTWLQSGSVGEGIRSCAGCRHAAAIWHGAADPPALPAGTADRPAGAAEPAEMTSCVKKFGHLAPMRMH